MTSSRHPRRQDTTASAPARLLLVFLDGVGLAPASPDNPLSRWPTPVLRGLLGGGLTLESVQRRDGVLLVPLDACLGVPGLPQSATGQTALFTGVNAPALLGRHVTALPGPRLKGVLEADGLLGRARGAGRRVTFANAYTEGYLRAVAEGRRRPSATTWMASAAGLRLRTVGDLRAGRAVTWDVCRDELRRLAGVDVPEVEPREAGRHLAAICGEHDLTLYESFYPDVAGHERWGLTAREAVRRIDGLIGGLLESLPGDVTLIVTSDHGNLEDASQRLHTRNPVPLLAAGPGAPAFAGATTLLDVTPAILSLLAPPGSS